MGSDWEQILPNQMVHARRGKMHTRSVKANVIVCRLHTSAKAEDDALNEAVRKESTETTVVRCKTRSCWRGWA